MNRDSIKALLEREPLRIAILFGSLAAGNARPDSDLDIAVAAGCRLNSADKLRLIDKLSLLVGRPVDLVDLRTAGEPLLGQILQKGDRLFVRDQRLFAELIKRHLFDSADFLPYRRRILAERRQAWIGT
ncbi:MAG: nucleotidyltransferase domain-containing protein [Burkholderiaceae bacterium]|nr:nucleotidyltransferase domain-containing protein [Gammaproteobacteria bacterium]